MRALFVSHDSALYGAQLSLLGLLSQINREAITPIVMAPYEGPLTERIRALDIPVHIIKSINWIAMGEETKNSRINMARRFLFGLKGRVWPLAHFIERNSVDLVYTNTLIPIDGLIAAHITNRPHIWHLREQLSGNAYLKSILPAWTIPHIAGRLSSRIIVNSKYLGKVYAHGKARNKIRIIYNGVDPADFDLNRHECSQSVRTELKMNIGERIATMVGSVIPGKGQLIFAQAAARLASRLPNVSFLIVGDGEADYIREIREFSQANGIGNKILFLGWRSDIPRLLAASEVHVVASDREPFGRTVIESMATGTPVVSTRCGGPEEIILHEQTGLLIPVGNAEALADSIERVLEDASFREGLSEAGKQRFHSEFTLKAHAAHVEAVLAEVSPLNAMTF